MTDSTGEIAANTASQNTLQIHQASTLVQQMCAEIEQAVIGQREVIEQVLVALFAAGHVLIEGVPGLGKTLLVRAMAKTFDGEFSRIQFTPDLMPGDVSGHAIYDPKTERFAIRRGPVFTNLLLADEINRAPAKTQSALLEVMQEQQVTIEGKPMPVPQPFMALATQNPIEHEGTYPLPEAQLDRFLLKINIAYLDEDNEISMLESVTGDAVGDTLDVSQVRTVIQPGTVRAMQAVTARLQVDSQIYRYAIRLVRATREWQGITIGSGPRGGIALIRAARAIALLQGRDYVMPDDVKKIALPALRHRILLAPELELEGQSPDRVLQAIIDQVEAPRQ